MLTDRVRTNEIYNIAQTLRAKEFNKRALAFGAERENDNSIELFSLIILLMDRIEKLEGKKVA